MCHWIDGPSTVRTFSAKFMIFHLVSETMENFKAYFNFNEARGRRAKNLRKSSIFIKSNPIVWKWKVFSAHDTGYDCHVYARYVRAPDSVSLCKLTSFSHLTVKIFQRDQRWSSTLTENQTRFSLQVNEKTSMQNFETCDDIRRLVPFFGRSFTQRWEYA